MEPHEFTRLIGRPKKKRDRTADEARKRKGEWSSSRKNSIITCSACGQENHNKRGCHKVQSGRELPKKTKDRGKEKIGETSSEKSSQQSFFDTEANTQQSTAYGPDIDSDEDPPLRPKVISEERTILASRKLNMTPPTGCRRIQFIGDVTGVSTPTNLPYSPKKTTWMGKEAINSSQLQDEVRKKRAKKAI